MDSKKPAAAPGRAGFFKRAGSLPAQPLHTDDDHRDVKNAEGHARKRAGKTLNHFDFPCFGAVQHNGFSNNVNQLS
ncbi:hypothetical protein [Sphingosinicella sp. BN140058]|uniref:hypothetical protein n=1 Tax=Sphingosinicella sp. BN140058 TaxID=1892855 RepID=UPI0010124F61|nr:hypothetical protein [Sphingosinicella sp. BN140058]QAY78465.1 hypothetical protein ETR14_19410 [Sphingosinicella sp. BN140058]